MSQGDIRPPERPLSRIPFSPRAEQTIRALANWMQVAAVISMVAAGAKLVAAFTPRRDFSNVVDAVVTFLIGLWIYQAGPWLSVALAIALVAAAVSLWQNFALYHAGDYFNLVARTDTADLDYLARGLDRLLTYFKIQVLLVAVTVAVAFGAALAVVAVTRSV